MQETNSKIRDNILLQMSFYIDPVSLNLLKNTIEEEFNNVDIKDRETLPAVVEESIQERNRFIRNMFLLKKRNLAEGTKQAYLRAVNDLAALVDKPLDEVTDMDISYYLGWYETRQERRGGKRNSPTSVNNEKRFLSAFFSFMRKNKLISENPVETVENLKVDQKPIDYYSEEEVEKIRQGCKTLRDLAMVETMRSTGLRVTEVSSLDIGMIDWDTGDVYVKRLKGGTADPAYIDDRAKECLLKYLDTRTDDNTALFVGHRKPHKRLAASGIRSVLKEITNRVGMTCRVYPHKFRKTLGMDMLNAGADITTVQATLGHQSPDTTAKSYAQLTPETLRERRRALQIQRIA